MSWPSIDDFRRPRAEGRYSSVLKLQSELNRQLFEYYEEIQYQDSTFVAKALIAKVERLVDELNDRGYNFGRIDYGGDIDFEKSEQWFSNGKKMGTGIIIHFRGFSAQVIWRSKPGVGMPLAVYQQELDARRADYSTRLVQYDSERASDPNDDSN